MPARYNSIQPELETGGPVTPEKLLQIAEWLDLADAAFSVLATLSESGEEPEAGTGVQEDLRRWADEAAVVEAEAILTGTARICHEANRALQVVQADPSIPVSPSWDDCAQEQRDSVMQGVMAAFDGTDPATSHANWFDFKTAKGWTWGPVKDEVGKRHPLLVLYDELPESARVKDRLFLAVVEAMLGVD